MEKREKKSSNEYGHRVPDGLSQDGKDAAPEERFLEDWPEDSPKTSNSIVGMGGVLWSWVPR